VRVRLKFIPDNCFIGFRWHWFDVTNHDLHTNIKTDVRHCHLWVHLLPCVAVWFHWRARR
jgi:hypothetical protein